MKIFKNCKFSNVGRIFLTAFEMQGKIYIGTSGWHYKDWKEVFYPRELNSSQWLEYYKDKFDTTEINNSFYRLPNSETVKKWADQVPARFKFSPKFSRYLTHMKKLNDPEEPFEKFFDAFKNLDRKMGIILLQLPPNLGYDEEKALRVFELIKERYNSYHFALEVRHKSWLAKESIKLLEKYNIAFTISHAAENWPYAEHVTSREIYMRFHGPKKLFNSKYSDQQLKRYAKKIKEWSKAGHRIWVYFNNDYHGYAIENAQALKRMVATLNL